MGKRQGEFPGAGNGLPFAAVSRLPSRAAMGRGSRRGNEEKDSEGLGEGEGKRRGQRASKVGLGGLREGAARASLPYSGRR